MVFGVTGNITKPQIWEPLRQLIKRFTTDGIDFVVSTSVANGLEFPIAPERVVDSDRFARKSDIVLSFGGDGTLLNTVHELGSQTKPILGVNVGRLGFLANTEVQTMDRAIDDVLAGRHEIDTRTMLRVSEMQGDDLYETYALNEIVIARAGVAGLITIEVDYNDEFLNAYWADGLVVSTPTGSTAYSLSAGGPILTPGCGAFVVTPLAAHSLGERPIVLPDDGVLRIRIGNVPTNCVYAVDGRSRFIEDPDTYLEIGRASREVNLVRLPGQTFGETLRRKLKWGSDKERS
ncbi:MAG: NAD(+)/NADH kinase [Bacteroidetes bacterium]|nr:NAD(+)/NADH kinase [Bacteroidota bacterium]